MENTTKIKAVLDNGIVYLAQDDVIKYLYASAAAQDNLDVRIIIIGMAKNLDNMTQVK